MIDPKDIKPWNEQYHPHVPDHRLSMPARLERWNREDRERWHREARERGQPSGGPDASILILPLVAVGIMVLPLAVMVAVGGGLAALILWVTTRLIPGERHVSLRVLYAAGWRGVLCALLLPMITVPAVVVSVEWIPSAMPLAAAVQHVVLEVLTHSRLVAFLSPTGDIARDLEMFRPAPITAPVRLAGFALLLGPGMLWSAFAYRRRVPTSLDRGRGGLAALVSTALATMGTIGLADRLGAAALRWPRTVPPSVFGMPTDVVSLAVLLAAGFVLVAALCYALGLGLTQRLAGRHHRRRFGALLRASMPGWLAYGAILLPSLAFFGPAHDALRTLATTVSAPYTQGSPSVTPATWLAIIPVLILVQSPALLGFTLVAAKLDALPSHGARGVAGALVLGSVVVVAVLAMGFAAIRAALA